MGRGRAWALGLLIAALLPSCTRPEAESIGADDAISQPTVTLPVPGVEGGPRVKGTIRVFAAAELVSVLGDLEHDFVGYNTGAHVDIRFGDPRELIVEAVGGPLPDFFVANASSVATFSVYVPDSGRVSVFGRDEYVLATGEGNPAGVVDLAGFAQADRTTVCTPAHLQPRAGQTVPELLPVDSVDPPGCGPLAALGLGEGAVDAAVLPRSVAARFHHIEVHSIPAADNIAVTYQLARTSDTAVALGFENLIRSDDGAGVRHGNGYL